VCPGFEMGFDYDAMLAKLCVWAPTRPRAVERLRRALGEYDIQGLTTNLEFLKRVVEEPSFIAGTYDTGFIEEHRSSLLDAPSDVTVDEKMAAAALVVDLQSTASLTPGHDARVAGDGFPPSAWREAHRRQRLGYRA
jgi:acetyl/propionyl-CoA carboxylase alpha subunit